MMESMYDNTDLGLMEKGRNCALPSSVFAGQSDDNDDGQQRPFCRIIIGKKNNMIDVVNIHMHDCRDSGSIDLGYHNLPPSSRPKM